MYVYMYIYNYTVYIIIYINIMYISYSNFSPGIFTYFFPNIIPSLPLGPLDSSSPRQAGSGQGQCVSQGAQVRPFADADVTGSEGSPWVKHHQ